MPRAVFRRLCRRFINHPVHVDIGPLVNVVSKIKLQAFTRVSDDDLRQALLAWRSVVPQMSLPRHASRFGGLLLPVEMEVAVFAMTREAARRTIGLDPFDGQMAAGLAMAHGALVELPTGEGKTLAAVFPAVLHALSGRGVHILTFNDYLARRDAGWMGPIFQLLGLSVGCVQEGMAAVETRAAYACDVTYATAKQAGFDFLRDGLVESRAERIMRPFHVALVDEADSILVDEARIPLVIAGADEAEGWDLGRLTDLARDLVVNRDYATDAGQRNVFLLDAGIERAELVLRCGSLYAPENQHLLEALHCALHARALLRRDVDYLVRAGRIEIVDELTGRVVEQRHWPDGLQAAVEAKEGLTRRSRGRVLGSIMLQHFFGLYPFLAGMTATARSAAEELRDFYGLDTVIVPPRVPSCRIDHPDVVFPDRAAKQQALVREIAAVHESGRPILVGTASVKESEILARDLERAGVACSVLNAKNDEDEAGIIANAGLRGAVTISTNMAGRGTDIKLGGADERERADVVALGGLYVIGTNRHESLRIDRQLRGRAARQGDPGATRFFISFEDDLFERYGLTQTFSRRARQAAKGGVVSMPLIRRAVTHAQRVIEGQHFDIRRRLAKYSTLVELQRGFIQERRDSILDAESVAAHAADGSAIDEDDEQELVPLDLQLRAQGRRRFGRDRLFAIERSVALSSIDRLWSEHIAWAQDARESIHLVSLGGLTPIDEFRKVATAQFLAMTAEIDKSSGQELRFLIEGEGSVDAALARLKGPSSTWTYLVNDQEFGTGVGLIQTANIGRAAAAALSVGPLLVLMLIADRWKKRRARESAASRRAMEK